MDTSTGRFISQDSYAGSTADPVSLHKYLYANSNPVTYSDPSGYYSLGDTMTTCAVLGALSGGIINASMNVLRFLCGDPDITSKYDSPISAFLNGFVNGMVWGLFFGITVGVLLTLGIFVAAAVAFDLGFSYYYYSLAKSALEAEDWASAVYYSYLCLFSVTCAFVTYSSAVDNKKLAEEQARNASSNGDKSSCPIKIPENAKVTYQTKNGYSQVKYNWSSDGYKYEARWHTRTPGAPATQGNTWVITRTTPGTATGQVRVQHVLTQNGWVTMNDWQAAIAARQNGTATPEQEEMLTAGHWVE